jgi:peptidoglycan/LPS O-acetylase OafA/YrhL
VLVIVSHLEDTLGTWATLGALRSIFDNGRLGVTVFFVISGFLITRLLLREQQLTGSVSLRNFYVRRALRILPAFYFYMGVVGLLAVAGKVDLGVAEFLSAIFFYWGYNLNGVCWFVSHTWSLAIEELFYLAWPTVLVLCRPRRASALALTLIALMPLIRVLMYIFFPEARARLQYMFHTNLDGLMLGCLVALWWNTDRFRRLLAWCYRWNVPFLAFGYALIISPYLNYLGRGAYTLTVGRSLEAIGATLLVIWAIDHPLSFIGRTLNWKPVMFVGYISYSLYLWQQMFLTEYNHTISGRFPWNILATIAAALLSYWVIEQPFQRLKQRWTPKTRKASIGV